jgi:hypothetical protein
MTTTTTDHFSRLNARRDELLALNAEKTRVVTKRLADLRGQVLTVRADAAKFARAYHLQKANALRADAANIDAIIRTLSAVELPKLIAEQEAIRQYRVPELAALWTAANSKVQTSKTDNTRMLANDLVSARAAFEAHVSQLATKQTLALAQAVADAAAAANADAGSVVLALLATKQAA